MCETIVFTPQWQKDYSGTLISIQRSKGLFIINCNLVAKPFNILFAFCFIAAVELPQLQSMGFGFLHCSVVGPLLKSYKTSGSITHPVPGLLKTDDKMN